jgi:parallel beta-helix repeat protein
MPPFCYMRLSSVNADSNIIHVPSVEYPTIQDAIDSAIPGTTIFVARGTYVEHFSIRQSLFLIGEDRDTTIIDGFDAGNVIAITADNVAIESLTITKSVPRTFDTGIAVDRARGIFVNNTKIVNVYTGLSFYSSTNNVISNSIIANDTSGIVLLYSNNNLFSNNIFSGNARAISASYSILSTFVGNTFSRDSVGVFLESSSNRNYFYHNNFKDEVQISNGSYNTWNRGNEGNYWASYNFTGRDVNDDGIGEEPYRLDDSNVDYYPLMGTYAEYGISFGNVTYLITIISGSAISDLRFEIDRETGNKIINFNVAQDNGTIWFCRIMIPTSLMGPPFKVASTAEVMSASLLSVSNATNSYLYFSYPSDQMTVSVIYSRELELYEELLDDYAKLKTSLLDLNSTYQSMLTNYTAGYQTLLSKFNALLENFTRLQNDLLSLDSSLRQSLSNQSESAQNSRNLAYVFAALTAAFLVTTVYLSSRLYAAKKPKNYLGEEEAQASSRT